MATQQNAPPPRHEGRASGALDAEIQQQVAELNLRGIGAIRGALAGGAAAARPAPVSWPAAIQQLGAQWLALDDAAQQRLAASPYVLFEFDFAAALRPGTVPPRSVQESRGDPGASAAISSLFVSVEGRAFARLLLHYAWHLVRSAPTSAGFVLGVPPAILEQLRALGLPRVDAIAEGAGSWVRLRWEHEPLVWGAWLAAARSGDAAAIWASQLRGLQRIAGACRDLPPAG